MSSSDLPKRNSQGYKITDITLEVTTAPEVAKLVTRGVQLPSPPPGLLGEMALILFMRDHLVSRARAALKLLASHETRAIRDGHKAPQNERVQIKLFSGSKPLGHVDGEGRVYDLRGKLRWGVNA